MAYPEDHGYFILDTDACDFSIGAVLSQIQDGRDIAKTEKNYCITDKERLAVRSGGFLRVLRFHPPIKLTATI
jgi:hypothetical protein